MAALVTLLLSLECQSAFDSHTDQALTAGTHNASVMSSGLIPAGLTLMEEWEQRRRCASIKHQIQNGETEARNPQERMMNDTPSDRTSRPWALHLRIPANPLTNGSDCLQQQRAEAWFSFSLIEPDYPGFLARL